MQIMPRIAKIMVSTRVRNKAWKCIISTLGGIFGFSTERCGANVGGSVADVGEVAESAGAIDDPGLLSGGKAKGERGGITGGGEGGGTATIPGLGPRLQSGCHFARRLKTIFRLLGQHAVHQSRQLGWQSRVEMGDRLGRLAEMQDGQLQRTGSLKG